METGTPPGTDPAPAPAEDPGTAPSGPGAPTTPPPAETPPAQQPGTDAPQEPTAPAQPDAPSAQAPDAEQPAESAQAAQEGPLATSVHIESIQGTVVLDGVGTAKVTFYFEEQSVCTVILEGDPFEVDVEWPPEAPTHSSVQAGLVRAAQAAAQKASGQ